MENSLTYSAEVKKGLIALLMFDIYSAPKTIYREYVQNALDSINNAISKRILAQAKDGVVKITIDAPNKIITIKDNGTGINEENAVRTLLDISASTKDGVNQAGQFGIGRLVGGGHCHELIFRTTAKDESRGTQIKFDVDKIWKMVKEDPTEYLATQVIDGCTKREHFEANRDEHYFEVILNGVKDDSASDLLNKEKVIEYLQAVAPVGYKSQFKNNLIYGSTVNHPEFRKLHEGLEKIQLFVDKTPIEKQYGLSINGTGDAVNNLEYFKIEDDKFGELGWGWFALTKYSKQIPSDDTLACIRLRKHNIQIGNHTQLSGTEYWKEERSNSYFYGEFFVTHPNIGPNAARDGLVKTDETKALYEKLKEYFNMLKNLYTKANEAKSSINNIKKGIERWKNKKYLDYKAKDLIENKGIATFERLVNNARFAPIQGMLELYRPDYEKARKDVEETKKQLSPVESSQPPIPSPPNPDGGATGTTKEKDASPADKVDDLTGNSPDLSTLNPDGGATGTTKEKDASPAGKVDGPTEIPPSSPKPPFGQQDIISPLQALLEPSEVWTIRRIFHVLTTYCPQNEHDQKLIEEMKRLIVKEFSNGN